MKNNNKKSDKLVNPFKLLILILLGAAVVCFLLILLLNWCVGVWGINVDSHTLR